MSNENQGQSFDSWIPLREAGIWVSGGTPDTRFPMYWGGDTPWISAASLKRFDVTDSPRKLTNLGVMAVGRLAPPGSVIFVVRGMSLQNELRVGVVGRPVAFGQDCKVIVPRGGIDGRFLAYFLLSKADYFVRSAEASGHGTKRLVTRFVGDVEVPKIDLSEQCQIVGILDSVDQNIDVLQDLLGKLDLLRLGQVNHLIFSGVGPDWVQGIVQDFGDVRMGRQRSPKHEEGDDMVPYLRVANVFDGCIDYSDVLEMNFTPDEQRVYGLIPGDILLNEGQSLDLVGRSAIYRGHPGGFCYQNTLIRYRCFDSLDPEFAYLVFQAWLKRGYFSRVALQTTSIAHLGGDRFARMEMEVPPLEEQRRIVSIIQAHDERIAAEKAKLEKLRKLKAGLMNDLMTGRVRVNQLDDLPV